MLVIYYRVRLDLGMTYDRLMRYSLTYVCYFLICMLISKEVILVLIIY